MRGRTERDADILALEIGRRFDVGCFANGHFLGGTNIVHHGYDLVTDPLADPRGGWRGTDAKADIHAAGGHPRVYLGAAADLDPIHLGAGGLFDRTVALRDHEWAGRHEESEIRRRGRRAHDRGRGQGGGGEPRALQEATASVKCLSHVVPLVHCLPAQCTHRASTASRSRSSPIPMKPMMRMPTKT